MNKAVQKWILLLTGGVLLFLLRGMLGRMALLLLASATLAYLLCPLEKWFSGRLHLRAGLSAVLTFVCAGGALGLLAGIGLPAAARQAQALSRTAPAVLEGCLVALEGLSAQFQAIGLPKEMLEGIRARAGDALGAGAALLMEKVGVVVRAVTSRGYLIFAPLLAFYFLRDRERLFGVLTRLLPSKHRMEALRVLRSVQLALNAYRDGQIKVSLVTGCLTALGLLLLGLDAWLLLGAVMALCNLVPYFGPWLGAAPIVLFAAEKGIRGVAGGLAVVVLAQQIESMAVSPRIIGDAARMHPALVILSLMAGGWLAGLPGMFYAIPAALCARAGLGALREKGRSK